MISHRINFPPNTHQFLKCLLFLDYSDIKEFSYIFKRESDWTVVLNIVKQHNYAIQRPHLPSTAQMLVWLYQTTYIFRIHSVQVSRNPWRKTKVPFNVYLWLCTIYRHKYLMNLLWTETPVVKVDPITTQQNTTLAEVDQDTVKPSV